MFHKYSSITRFIVGIIITVAIVTGCGKANKESSNKSPVAVYSTPDTLLSRFPREQSLYIGGFQWGPPTSFNPLAVTPAWPVAGNINLLYEAMFGYNSLDGSLRGILGQSFKFEGRVLKIHLHNEAKWQDGDSLTSADVVYSFLLHRSYPTSFSYIWNYIADIKASGAHDIAITLNDKMFNPLVAEDIIASLPILPAKTFKQIEDSAFKSISQESGTAPSDIDVIEKIRDFKNDQKPVGSGPYALECYSDRSIVLKRVDNYWGNILHSGKQPAPQFIIHSTYSTNDEFNVALQKGDLDLSQNFFPEIWKAFHSGVGTWYSSAPYYIPGIMPALLMGLTREPFGDVAFRKAVAHSIDYEEIRSIALYGYSLPLQPGLIFPFGSEKQFFSEEDATAFGSLYDPVKAKEILRSAGYSWGSDSMLIDPKGKKVRPLYATCPKGWADWEKALEIAVYGMRAIGIDVQEKVVEYADWDNGLKRGLFDFTMKTPLSEQSASMPWSRFEQIMASTDLHLVGEVTYRNEERYKNPLADSLLAAIPCAKDPQTLKKLYRDLNKLFMEEMPIIPLMYRPWLFYQFNSNHWNNFPTVENPYAAPQCLMVGAGIEALWGIVPAAKK